MAFDYHDWPISQLELTAKEQLGAATASLAAGEEHALERIDNWSRTLDRIREIKEHKAVSES